MVSLETKLLCIFASCIVIFLINVNQVNCDYYTSLAGLEELLESEKYLLETYENYIKFLKEVEENVQAIEENPESYYDNPLNAFKTIKRFTVDWKVMMRLILLDPHSQEFSANFTKMTSLDYGNATAEDLVGASNGLARLQKTYALTSADIAHGILMDSDYGTLLSAHDCFQLGRILYDAQDYNRSTDWLLQARLLLKAKLEDIDKNDESITSDFPYLSDVDILEYLAPSMFNMSNYKMARILNEELLMQDSDNQFGLKNKNVYEMKVLTNRRMILHLETKEPETSETNEVDELTEAVCRGSVHQTPAEQRELRCRYVHNSVPYCLIAPFKMEELSHDPFVAFYHNTIYENEMQSIINVSKHSIKRSGVVETNHSTISEIRISKNTWLSYKNHSFLNAIHKRLQHITGLNLDLAEPLQVVNYGIGGYYGPHHDFADDPDKYFTVQGNRIVTALFYINEVELGGATAFPYLRLAVPPIRGSLVVWNNLHESLELDYRTLHSGCPVLKGFKWVCNEWFHQVGQEFTRPCSLERNGEKSLPYRNL